MTGIDYRAPDVDQQVSLLARYLPSGRLWHAKYDRRRILGRLVEAFAQQIDRSAQIIELFVRELDPDKTFQLLLEHEESVGIPDQCFDRSPDIEERRRRIIQKLNNFGGIITRDDIEGVLADFGEAIQIVPGTVDNAQQLGFPAPPYDADQRKQIKHTVAVRVSSDADAFALDFPIEFATELSGLLQCLVQRITPANVDLQFFFNQDLNQPFFVAPSSFFGTNVAPFVEDSILSLEGAAIVETAPFVEDSVRAAFGGTISEVAPFVADIIDADNTVDAVAPLDAWTNESSSESTPGSKTVSAGTNRVLMVKTTTTQGGSLGTVTGVSYGGQAMTLVDEESTTSGRQMHSALWILDEAGIAAAVGTAFSLTTSGTSSNQFRLDAASYENVDQTTPQVAIQSEKSSAVGVLPSIAAMTSVADGYAIFAGAINRDETEGAGDDNTITFNNLTEQLANVASASTQRIGDSPTTGASFTPDVDFTLSSSLGRGDYLAVTLRPA